MKHTTYDAIIVGGGIAGLTAAAYLSKAGRSVLVCEKEARCGGLVKTFVRDGFVYDGGIRAMENSGVTFPMLKKLGLEIEFVPNRISIGIEGRVIHIDSRENVQDYQELLTDLYPESRAEIEDIMRQVRQIMQYMEVQYGIDNPLFLDMQEDREYLMTKILPWMVKYALTVPRISKLQVPVVDFLKRYTQNQSLLDIICQHFFQETPAFFALSYITLYLDYHYPLGGTGKVIEKMTALIESQHGTIQTDTEITAIDPDRHLVTDAQGRTHAYKRLVWAADQKTLYRLIEPGRIADPGLRQAIGARRALIEDKRGNDSVFTLFLAVELDRRYFAEKASGHFFYTPDRGGQTRAGPMPVQGDQPAIKNWLERFLALTTYEISIPVMRDETLAPPGKTGLIISLLFDYQLVKHIEAAGWYEAFKLFCEDTMIRVLDGTIYPGLGGAVLHRFSSTPLTLARMAGTADGAIVGWSFTNNPLPAENRLPRILNAIKTPIPHILQAGQWTYSPAGLPISILTGKLAADRIIRELSKS